jgi:hypothetical protein
MSKLELRLLQQSTADKTPVLPVLGLCFEESELILLIATIASESRERSERRYRREIVRLTKIQQPRKSEVETGCVLIFSCWICVSQTS